MRDSDATRTRMTLDKQKAHRGLTGPWGELVSATVVK